MKIIKKLIIIFCVIIGILIIFKISGLYEYTLKKMYPLQHLEYVEKYSEEFGVDKYYIYAIIKAESNYDTQASSHKGAQGLMQILPATAKEIASSLGMNVTEENLYEVETNIMLGTKYFANLQKSYNNVMLALAAYNAGPRKCKQMDRRPEVCKKMAQI